LATTNVHKSREVEEILRGSVTLLPRPDDLGNIEESGETLLENARLKAEAVAKASGAPAIADDTGLFIDALEGLPGVRSARYAGDDASDEENVEKVLASLSLLAKDGVSATRKAAFHTVAIVVFLDGEEVSFEGVTSGSITTSKKGSEGFGYDVIFVPDEGDGRTFAEMSSHEKHAISHRGKAFRGIKPLLDAIG
jgi:XTP/dITP diphosphohydrolase